MLRCKIYKFFDMGCDFCGLKTKELDDKINRARSTLSLNLDGEDLVCIDSLNSIQIPNLNVFSVNNNKLSNLPVTFLRNSLNLKKIDCSMNIYELIDDVIFTKDSLQIFNFSLNFIQMVDIRFQQLHNLKELYLSGNKINQIDNSLIFDSLEVLDLSCNYLKFLPWRLILSPKLEFIDLHNNEINTLPENWEESNTKTINLETNKLDNLPASIFSKSKLSLIILKGNLITLKQLYSYEDFHEYEKRRQYRVNSVYCEYINLENCGLV